MSPDRQRSGLAGRPFHQLGLPQIIRVRWPLLRQPHWLTSELRKSPIRCHYGDTRRLIPLIPAVNTKGRKMSLRHCEDD